VPKSKPKSKPKKEEPKPEPKPGSEPAPKVKLKERKVTFEEALEIFRELLEKLNEGK